MNRKIKLAIKLVLSAVAAGLVVYLFVFSSHGYLRFKELEAENAELEERITKAEKENAQLREEIKRMESDLEAVEELLRTDLGLIRDGEVVYRFIEKDKE